MNLQRKLGLTGVVSIACGAMLSGLFILPGLAYSITGPSVLASYLIAALLAATGMLSQAELASAMPKAGGAYFFVSRSLGPSVGTVYGIITWLSLCLKSAVELLAISVFAVVFLDIDPRIIAFGLCLFFVFINLLGIREAGKIQTILVIAIFAALILYVVAGVNSVHFHRFEPFSLNGMNGIVAGAGFIFVSFGGLLKIASIAEEVKDPGENLPKGMIISSILMTLVYLSVIFICIGVLVPADISGAHTPISLGAQAVLGGRGAVFFHFIGMLSIFTAANAGVMAASRYPLALSRDGLFPEIFSGINSRFNTPHISILITGALILCSLFFSLRVVIKAASSVLILTYAFSCISIIIMRESRLQNYLPHFRSPFYPWIQIVGIFGFAVLLFQTGVVSVLIAFSIIFAGALLHWYYGETGANREFALLHLIERITQKEYTDYCLETELKQIIHERDNISKDQFDKLIEDCILIDLDRPMNKDEFFDIVAGLLAEKVGMRKAKLNRKLLEREEESSTVLSPYLAIPHVIIPGQGLFDIIVVRSRDGISFSHSFQKVHAVFVLLGTRDTRSVHLHSLAAIAQIVQDPEFERRWMKAKNEKALRDIILLSKRTRQQNESDDAPC